MIRRILFLLGLVSAVYGGWIIHGENSINRLCNANMVNPRQGVIVSTRCLNIVWPYSEGFIAVIGGGLMVFAALMLTRRVMSGERQYMKDLKAGRYSRENDHLNSYNFSLQKPVTKATVGASRHAGGDSYE